jgi:hypothetical protein
MQLKNSISINVDRDLPETVLHNFLTVCRSVSSTPDLHPEHVTFATWLRAGQLTLPADLQLQELPEDFQMLGKHLQGPPTDDIENINAQWFVRNKQQQKIKLTLTRQSDRTFDTITFEGAKQHAKAAEAALASVAVTFRVGTFLSARFANLPAELRAFHLSQEAVFAQRETALLAGHERLSRTIVEAEERAAARVEDVKREYEQYKKKLDAKHEEATAQLQRDRKKFDEEKREFDDRERMHVRRDRENQLKTVLEKSKELELSKKTAQKRWPVHFACLLSLLASGALYGAVVWHGLAGAQLGVVHYSMLATATVLFGSTLVFYLRWLSAWAQKHATGELRARAYGQDLLRAYWLVELLFEWRKENEQSEFPAEVLETLASGLFGTPDAGADIAHPLASLVDSASQLKKLSVNPKSVEIERFESAK